MKKLALAIYLAAAAVSALAQTVKYDEWSNLTTSGKLPKECVIQKSNNNLDLVKYKDRFYVAFRTAPTHFASKKTVLYVISSTDLDTWTFEKEIKLGCDVREPRFAVYHDTLNLYFFTGGANMFKFEPRQIMMCHTAAGGWGGLNSIGLDGFVPWRLRQLNDTLYLSAYYGRHLYKKNHHSDLRLFQSTDGAEWARISIAPQIDVMNAEEGEFIFDKHGDLYSTVRLEGTGAFICKADKCCIDKWKKVRTKYKYDSALLFDHNDDIYLVSRRNMDGPMDKVKNRKNEKQRKGANLIRYSITRKVTSLFKLNKQDLTLTAVTDFPSTGDCSYAGITKLDNNTYLLMNYSSNIKGRKKNWISGQLGKTYIYWTKLRFDQ